MSLLGQVSDRYQNKEINLTSCVIIFEEYLSGSTLTVEEIIREKNLQLITDEAEIRRICAEVLEKNPKSVRKYLNGKTSILDILSKKAFKTADGKATQKTLNDTLEKLLEEKR